MSLFKEFGLCYQRQRADLAIGVIWVMAFGACQRTGEDIPDAANRYIVMWILQTYTPS